MDAQGKVFVHGDVSAYAALPALSGPDGGAQDVLADYNSFVALTGPRGLGIAQLTVDARGAASVRLSDGIEVRLGREAAQQRLARFGAVALPALGAQLSSVAYVDMRYTNGFAVGWKTATVSGSVKRGEVRPDV
jgi:cell division protein FtsQ